MFFKKINYIKDNTLFLYFGVYDHQKLTMLFEKSMKKFMVIT